jgi:hypothetical protein
MKINDIINDIKTRVADKKVNLLVQSLNGYKINHSEVRKPSIELIESLQTSDINFLYDDPNLKGDISVLITIPIIKSGTLSDLGKQHEGSLEDSLPLLESYSYKNHLITLFSY